MIAVDAKLLYEFVVSYLVDCLPLVKWNKIHLQQIPSMIPALIEPIRNTLVRHQLAKMCV
jgi:hypothetical protein